MKIELRSTNRILEVKDIGGSSKPESGEDLGREMNRKLHAFNENKDELDEDLNVASTKYKKLVDEEIGKGFSGSKQLHF